MPTSPQSPSVPTEFSRVLLVGAGHAHVEVLARWAAEPPAGAGLTLVVDEAHATYSGMVPGVVAGDYHEDQARIAVAPLADAAGAGLVAGRVVSIDPKARTVLLQDGRTLAYDVASLDVGSSVRGLDLPGVREHAVATRPIGEFLQRLDHVLRDRSGAIDAFRVGPLDATRVGPLDGPRIVVADAPRIVVVGAGAAGVELAFTLHAHLRAAGRRPDIVVVCGGRGLLPGYAAAPRRLLAREAAQRGITFAATSDVLFVDADGVGFASGHLRADVVVWATGAASPECIANSPLPHDPHGFVRVTSSLQVRGCPGLFAAGDCAAMDGHAWVPKAGVHAVRQGPVLDANLRAVLAGRSLRSYEPQRDFLSLLNLGGRRALATKWGLAASGRLPWILKDRIDRGFVERFRR